MTHKRTLLQQLDLCPPWVVRVAGRIRGRPFTVAEISKRSGLSRRTVARLEFRKSWGITQIATSSAFCAAVRINPLNRRQLQRFIWRYGEGRYRGFTTAQRRKFERLEKGL